MNRIAQDAIAKSAEYVTAHPEDSGQCVEIAFNKHACMELQALARIASVHYDYTEFRGTTKDGVRWCVRMAHEEC